MLHSKNAKHPLRLMVWREELVEFRKKVKGGEDIVHKARIITYVNMKNPKKPKRTRVLTNDLETDYEEIVATYDARWEIESLFKQLKQNFPLRYCYGESANAIKIQIWVTLIANLLLMLLQKSTTRSWSFSGLATMVRIMLMYYIDVHGFLEHPEKDWEEALEKALEAPPESEQN